VVFDEDPPPDLVVEVDITHTDIAKNQFYVSLRVPEFWRFNGQVWRVYVLREGVYQEVESSSTPPTAPHRNPPPTHTEEPDDRLCPRW